MVMMMDSSAPLHLKLLTLTVMLCLSLLSGFCPVFVMRRAARCSSDTGARLRALSLASCLSSGVFLASSLLDLLPEYLMDMRDTFSHLDITLRFPLAEFLLAMGFLTVLVVEQMLLAFREQACDSVSLEKQTLINTPERSSRTRVCVTEDGRTHVCLRVCLLLLCVCVHSLLDGLRAGAQAGHLLQTAVALVLHKTLLAFSLAVRLCHVGLRRSVVSGCLLLFCVSCPAGMGLGMGMVGGKQSIWVDLVRCAVEGLTSGVFISVSIGGLVWQESSSPKHRIHRVAFLLTGFALVTAVLFSKV